MNTKIMLLALIVSSCATHEKVICPTVAEEAISVCRAKQKCMNSGSSTGMGIGFGLGFPSPNSSSAVGMDISRNQTDDTYPNCIDHDLETQKSAISPGDKNAPAH